MKKKIFLSLFGVIFISSLTACSTETKEATATSKSSSSVEQKVSTESSEKETIVKTDKTSEFSLMVESAQSQIPQIKAQAGSAYKDISIEEGKNYTVIYNYTYAEKPEISIDADALRPTMVKSMKPTIDGIKGLFPEIKIEVNYLDPDGTNLASFTITSEDTDKVE